MTPKDINILFYVLCFLITFVTSLINFFESNLPAAFASLNGSMAWALVVWYYIAQDDGIR